MMKKGRKQNMSQENEKVMSTNELLAEIREITKKQKSASKVDEVRVMRSMLNDPDFKVSVYDKNSGLIGTRCPREEAVKFITNVAANLTGLEKKTATAMCNEYEFTKKDAMFMIDMAKDFNQVYLSSGRKLPIVQSADSEAAVFYRSIPRKEKRVPTTDKVTTVPPFNKVICKSKSPKYNEM